MKSICLVVLLFSFSAFANNPQQRACRLTGGLFHALNLDSDQVGFCVYGSSMMDSMSIMQSAESGTVSQAVSAFQAGSNSCESVGGIQKDVTDLENNSVRICGFADGSAIEVQTLANGPSSGQNSALEQALKVRY